MAESMKDHATLKALSAKAALASTTAVSTASDINPYRPSNAAQLDTGTCTGERDNLASHLLELGETLRRLATSLENAALKLPSLGGLLDQQLGACEMDLRRLRDQARRIRIGGYSFANLAYYLEAHRQWALVSVQSFSYFNSVVESSDIESLELNINSREAQHVSEKPRKASSRLSKSLDTPTYDVDAEIEFDDMPPPPYEECMSKSSPAFTDQNYPHPPEQSLKPFNLAFIQQSLSALTAWFRQDSLISALCTASSHGDTQQMINLIIQGANINGRNQDDGATPLGSAIVANQPEAAKLLLLSGANVKIYSKVPPLFQAVGLGCIEIAELLICCGCKATQTSISGHPYFYDIVNSETANVDGVRFLLNHGASPHTINMAGKSVISAAVKKGRLDLVGVLLDYGANVNYQDYTGTTLLSIGMHQTNATEMVALLLERGADPNQRVSASGLSALSAAVSSGQFEVAKLLIEAGANGKVVNTFGQPVLITIMRDGGLPGGQECTRKIVD